MPPTHQGFKDFKEHRISLGPWLCKLSEPSELSALSVPGSLDCWLPSSVAAWLPNRSIAPWLPGGLAPGRLEMVPRDPSGSEDVAPRSGPREVGNGPAGTSGFQDVAPRFGLREAGNAPAGGSSGSRLRGPETHGTRATGCLEGGGAMRGTPRGVFLGPPPLL